MDTNLYDFLRRIQQEVTHDGKYDEANELIILREEYEWLTTFLRNPGTVIEFRSRPTGRMIPLTADQALVSGGVMLADREEPELEKHFAVAGSPQEVFALLYEAMMLNPLLAPVMVSAARAYYEASPLCRACSNRHPGKPVDDCPDLEHPSWEFKERKK